MENIFTRGPSLNNRLALAIVMSIALILFDHKFDGFGSTRVYLNSLVSPLQYMANLPTEALSWTATRFTSHQQLRNQNAELTRQSTIMQEKLQRFSLLQQENARLRRLLGSPVREGARKMVAELMAVENNPFSHQIVINKGTINGVYEGQAVIDNNGIVGQILQVGTTNSRVILIGDVSHAIPVRVSRNNIRLVAAGTGRINELQLHHVPHSADLEVGDLLVSSGLGNVFPEGYPVAIITSIIRDEGRPFAQVRAEPVAQLDRLRYLLLLWPGQAQIESAKSAGGAG